MASALTNIVIVAGCASLAIFIALYAALAHWQRSPAGRALMMMSCGFFLVLLALTLRHPFNLSTSNSAFFQWFQAISIAVSIAGIWWITSVLIRVQWRSRNGRYFASGARDGRKDGAS